ncbi:MAG TPA: 1-(5-phosphoribosyl)-5-[(5-phosphoribosylamino)methylideneamino] imidazole-4-carboxamide isomerase [Terriglobales bacterium]|nr:1-(5-phosphoribosyl)-5-[(5-phosphoribosylamino)methylideneamino] imidazole-4-carboxamide isomerase [Terriglobales bacterium]
MLIPSIDLMGGKVVQLIQGEKKALEFDNFDEWVAKFASFPLVQLIDLDAAMGRAANSELIRFFVTKLPCQVGGGIRSIDAARAALDLGAKRVIVGSTLIQNGAINVSFAQELAKEFGPDKLVFAIDARGGKIAIRGWKELTQITPLQVIKALDQYCGAFLYTHIDTEGLMAGLPLDPVRQLRAAASKQLIAAGGITTHEEIDTLHKMGVDAVVGMALYLGRLSLERSSVQ